MIFSFLCVGWSILKLSYFFHRLRCKFKAWDIFFRNHLLHTLLFMTVSSNRFIQIQFSSNLSQISFKFSSVRSQFSIKQNSVFFLSDKSLVVKNLLASNVPHSRRYPFTVLSLIIYSRLNGMKWKHCLNRNWTVFERITCAKQNKDCIMGHGNTDLLRSRTLFPNLWTEHDATLNSYQEILLNNKQQRTVSANQFSRKLS